VIAMQRAYSLFTIKAIDDECREIVGLATTPEADRQGDVVEPRGAQFKLPMPLLWQHRKDQPIGQVIAARVEADGIHIRAQIAKGLNLPWIDEAYTLLKAGLVRGLSIGLLPDGLPEPIRGSTGFRIKKWHWVETSAVTIPANGSATIALVKSCDTPSPASGAGDRLPSRGASAARAGSRSMNASESLTIKRAELREKTTQLGDLLALETLSAEQQAQRAAITGELRDLNTDIDALDVLEAAQARMAQPVKREIGEITPTPTLPTVVQVKDNAPPGHDFVRMVMCKMAAYVSGGTVSALDVARHRYPDSPRVQLALKAAVAAGTTTNATWAGPLVYAETLTSEFLEYLRPMTIVGRIDGLRRVPFNVRIVGQTTGGAGYWVGQGKAKPLTKYDYNATTLGFAKVAAISVITEELARFSSPNAEALVRQGLTESLQERVDIDFIDPDKIAVTNVSPASITNGITPLPHTADPRADLASVFTALATAHLSPRGGHWIMPETVAVTLSMRVNSVTGLGEFPTITPSGGTLLGYPVVTSQYAAQGSPEGDLVIFVVAPEIYLSDDGGATVDVSREASLEMDSAPVGDSGVPTGATTMVSMWQSNSLALRAERFINWARRRNAAVQYFDGVTWTL
jgi:HK97 family phage major capsid protein/HK97 family phage prohead protease